MRSFALIALLFFVAVLAWPALAEPIMVVAAESCYGDVARQVGGGAVRMTSILANPDQDPHLFEAGPAAARAVASAGLVIYNGLGYDPWMPRLLRAAGKAGHDEIVVARLLGKKPGDNPHVWYDPNAMPAVADAVAAAVGRADAAQRGDVERRLDQFRRSLQPVSEMIARLRRRLAGTPVAATEPVFGYMLAALGMQVRGEAFQLAVMNDTEPGASAVAAFEEDLSKRRVRLLIYNRQVAAPAARRMLDIARSVQIPTVGVSETEPAGTDYQAWVGDALAAIDRALPE